VPVVIVPTVTVVVRPTVELILIKSEPFHAIVAFSPLTIVTPVVGPAPTILTDWDVEVVLLTMYVLLDAGTVIVKRLAGLPVQLMI